MLRVFAVSGAALMLAGCAATHQSKVGQSTTDASQGRLQDAIAKVDAQLKGDKANDVLLNLEKGELLRISSNYSDSMASFEIADGAVKQWEEKAKSAPAAVAGQIGATLLGDGFRDYEVQDYEKVMLTTVMAMNRLSQGDLDTARVDIKRTHEREAIIAEVRAKQTLAAEEEAKAKGAQVQSAELKGYPVETLNDPEVLALKNGYQNALSHYLSGFVYEALNEPSLAAPGYRQAIQLRPGSEMLEAGLKGLDERRGVQRKNGATDVLFVIESGTAPARESKKFMFPVPTPNGLVSVGMSYPVINLVSQAPAVDKIAVGETVLTTGMVADFNVMARRALKDELPGMQARAVVRMVAKAGAQAAVNKQVGALGGLLGNVAAAATEPPADDRMWRSLPSRVYVARAFIKPGEYNVVLPGQSGSASKLTVSGRYMVVPVRAFSSVTYFGEPGRFGDLDKPQPAEKPAPKRRAAPKSASAQ